MECVTDHVDTILMNVVTAQGHGVSILQGHSKVTSRSQQGHGKVMARLQ